jgi:hypothetical protein
MDDAQFRVLSAMLKTEIKRKPKLSPADHARRLALESERQIARYCATFALWRACARKACRRQRRCGGDAHPCLKRALGRVPKEMQTQARERILAATPHNIGAPEREARQRLPHELYD